VVGGSKASVPLGERTVQGERLGLPSSVVQVLDVGGRTRDRLGEVEGGLVHGLPGLEVGWCQGEVHIGPGDAELVGLLRAEVDPAGGWAGNRGGGVAVHLPNSAQGDRDPVRVGVGQLLVQEVQVGDHAEQ
jgi:hypothetical protein